MAKFVLTDVIIDLARSQSCGAATGCPACSFVTPTRYEPPPPPAGDSLAREKESLEARRAEVEKFSAMSDDELEREEILKAEEGLEQLLEAVRRIKAEKGIK